MDTTENGDIKDDFPASQAYVSDKDSSDDEEDVKCLEISKRLVFKACDSILVKSKKMDVILLEFNINNKDLFDYLKFKYVGSQDP